METELYCSSEGGMPPLHAQSDKAQQKHHLLLKIQGLMALHLVLIMEIQGAVKKL